MNTTFSVPEALPSSLAGSALGKGADGQPILIGTTCNACNLRVFPPVAVCPACMSEDVQPEQLPREGTLYSFTIVHVGPTTWAKPFALGYVDLSNGVRVFSHLAGRSLKLDDPVELAIGRIGTNPDGTEINTFVFQSTGA